MNIFWPGSFVKFPSLNRIQPILERLNKNIMTPWKPSIIDRSNKCGVNIGIHSNSRDWTQCS